MSVLFQTIQLNMWIKLNGSKYCYVSLTIQSVSQSFVYTQLNVTTVLFQTIQFSISAQLSSIWPIDRTLSGATTPGQSRPGSDGKWWGIPHYLKRQHYWNLTIRLESFRTLVGGVLRLCRDAVGVFYCTCRLGYPPKHDTKPSDGKVPVLELKGIWSTPSLPLPPDPLWPGVVPFSASNRTIRHLNCVRTNDLC